jgi:transposase InsO family protein
MGTEDRIETTLKTKLVYCTFTALIRKSLIINGAGEGNRTLVIITKSRLARNLLIRAQKEAKCRHSGPLIYLSANSSHKLSGHLQPTRRILCQTGSPSRSPLTCALNSYDWGRGRMFVRPVVYSGVSSVIQESRDMTEPPLFFRVTLPDPGANVKVDAPHAQDNLQWWHAILESGCNQIEDL